MPKRSQTIFTICVEPHHLSFRAGRREYQWVLYGGGKSSRRDPHIVLAYSVNYETIAEAEQAGGRIADLLSNAGADVEIQHRLAAKS